MDKKSTNTGVNKSLLKSLNRSYISEPIKDENKILELMSKFISGELDTINTILGSNEILNFKDSSGQTLIHAIIRNESSNISEEDKLQIIRTLVDKNVSLNSMTQLNQNPLHLACQRGYGLIITYLLANGCEQKLNDNNGNAPIHYLIEKFIDTCKQDDFYKPANGEIKSINSGQMKQINDIIKNQSIKILIELFEKKKTTDEKNYICIDDGTRVIVSIQNFIKNTTQLMLPNIYNMIDNKVSEINKIYSDFSDPDENKFEKAKNIVLNTQEEIKKFYNYNLDNDSTIWDDNFIQNQKEKIIANKKNQIEKINKVIVDISNNIKLIQQKLNKNMKKNYYDQIIKYVGGIFFVYETLKKYSPTQNLTDALGKQLTNVSGKLSNDDSGKPIKIYSVINDNNGKLSSGKNILFCNNCNACYCIINEINDTILNEFLIDKNTPINIFINFGDSIDNIVLLNKPVNLDDDSCYYEYSITDPQSNSNITESFEEGIPFFKGFENNGPNPSNPLIWNYWIPQPLMINKTNPNGFVDLKNRLTNQISYKLEFINEKYLWENKKKYFKYSSIRVLIVTINQYIQSLIQMISLNKDEDALRSYIQKIDLFYIKEFTNIMIKIINNLVILEKYIGDIDTKQLQDSNIHYKKIIDNLLREPNIKKNSSVEKAIKKLLFIWETTDIDNPNDSSNIFLNIKKKSYIDDINYIYNVTLKLFDFFSELVENINRYQSEFQFEKYNEFIGNYIKGDKSQVKLTNTIFNDYNFNIRKKFPDSYDKYKELYFNILPNINLYGKENIVYINDLTKIIMNPNYKSNLIENVFPYLNTFNFNSFYMGTDSIEYSKFEIYGDDPEESEDESEESEDESEDESEKSLNLNATEFTPKKPLGGGASELYLNDQTKSLLKFQFIPDSKYNLSKFINSNGKYKFARGYNIIQTDIKCEGKPEKNTLCDIANIKTRSEIDSSLDSILEDKSKVTKFNIQDF